MQEEQKVNHPPQDDSSPPRHNDPASCPTGTPPSTPPGPASSGEPQLPPPSAPRRRKRPRRPPSLDERAEILRLAEVGLGTREIARRLGLGRKQVRSVVEEKQQDGSLTPATPRQGSHLDPYRALIAEKVEAGLTVTRILREIAAEGYGGGRTILAQYVRSLRVPRLPRRKRPKRRFETAPAEELQADFGTYTVSIGGVRTTVHAFIVCLCYSRKLSVDVFRDQRRSTVFQGLEGAIRDDFQGATHKAVVDNITAIVLGRTEAEPGKRRPLFHPDALLFSRHYSFDFAPARPYDPDRKGKDENRVGFFERDVIRGSTFESWEDLRRRAKEWADRVNHTRHGTTGRVPEEVWREEEHALLIRLPEERFAVYQDEPRAVASDATLSISGTLYTVPAELSGMVVMVRLYAHHFEVLAPAGNVVLARGYVDPKDKGRLQLDPAHYAALPRRGRREPGVAKRLEETFRARFPGLSPLVDGITRRMKTLVHMHLAVLLRLADRYGEAAFRSAATRVQEARRYDARAVQRVLERDHPLAEEALPLPALGGAGAALLAEVEEGSLERFDALDDSATNNEPDGQGEEESHGA